MILFLNGAFGIGKTTVARAMVARLPSSVLFDPELLGIPLQRAARLVGRTLDDFQDLSAWRRLTPLAVRLARTRAQHVVVPMAISNPAYLEELRTSITRFEPRFAHFCLVAPLPVVERRLRQRGSNPIRHAWQFRRAAECCAVHGNDAFAIHVDAASRTPTQIAAHLLAHPAVAGSI